MSLLRKASIVTTPTAYENGKILSVKPNTSVGDLDFTRNSSATRVNSQGLIEDMQILSGDLVSNGDFSQIGSELVTNGDFSNGLNNWEVLSATSTDGGVRINNTITGTNAYIIQSNSNYTIGKSFVLEYDVIATNGTTLAVEQTSNLALNTSTIGNNRKLYFNWDRANTNFAIKRLTTGTDVTITNLSVKEVGQDWSLLNGSTINEGVAKVIADGDVGGLSTRWSLKQTVFEANKNYRVKFKARQTSGSGNFQVSRDFFTFIDQAITSSFVEYDITFNSGSSSFSGFLVFGGRTSGNIFEVTNISVIEITDDTNLPRIDYTGGVGHWLFEPQSTNLEDKSNGFITWSSNSNITRTADYITSPDGTQNATRLQFTANGFCSNKTQALASYTMSCYAKRNDSGTQNVGFFTNGSSGVNSAWEITSEWKRFSYTFPALNGGAMGIAGVSGADISVFGFQLEGLASYPTSYIPTSGSAVTRLADAAFGAGNSELFNDSEGVLFFNSSRLNSNQTGSIILSITDGSISNGVSLYYGNSGVICDIFNSSGTRTLSSSMSLQNQALFNKILIKYKTNDIALWINGFEVSVNTQDISISGLNQMLFSYGNNSFPFYGKTKCVAVFKEALIDSELECLSSWNSFTEMAIALGYTIE